MEKIIVAFEKESNARFVRELIETAGLAAVQVCRTGMEVRRLAGRESYPVVVCGYKLPDGAAEALFEDLPPETAMLMVAPRHQLELCGAEGVFRLAAPIHRGELLSAVETLLRLNRSPHPADRREGAQRGVVRQAKALLMARYGMDEEEAHRLLQKRSMDRGCKLAEMARLLLEELG